MSASYVLMEVVAPSLGFTLANVMFFSAVPEMLRRKRANDLGEMNPYPFPVIFANCVAWMAYSCYIDDYFLFFANAPGCMIGLFFTLVAYGLSEHGSRARDALERIAMALLVAMMALLFFVGIPGANLDVDVKRQVVGAFCNAVLLAYYAAPLSVMKRVIATRDSSSLHAPLAAANTVNGAAWFTYGMALGDWFLAAPNAIGAALGIIQLVLLRAYPRRKALEGTLGGVLPTAAGYVTPSLSAADLLAMQDGALLGSAVPVSSA